MPKTIKMPWPIVEQMVPSAEQIPAIKSRKRDVVVTAGAGAGKTRTLVARYLSLLAEGIPLRSIVAITFTKKAAREMRNRVREEMRLYVGSNHLTADEHTRWLRLYSELDAARIDTIHGFCTEIIRAHPAEAGVDPRFQVLEEGQESLLVSQAIDEGLTWAANNAAIVPLFALLGEEDLRATIERLVSKRLEAKGAFDRLPADLAEHYKSVIPIRQKDVLEALLACAAWCECVDILRSNTATDPDDAIENQRCVALGCINAARGALDAQVSALSGLDEINLRGGSAKLWPGGKEQCDEVKNAIKTLRSLWQEKRDLLTTSWTDLDEQLAQCNRPLRNLFRFVLERYEGLKRERDVLDFDDLEGSALILLENVPAVRERWQKEVLAMLVDEFQDTNQSQRKLVDLLNGGMGKLFIVGDAKQSIYRFRGADVAVFREARKEILSAEGDVISLHTSYRAHAPLIEGLNSLLRPVLGEAEDPKRPWLEPFAKLEHFREEPSPGFKEPHIELHATIGSKGGGALRRAADALAFRLAQLVGSGEIRIKEGEQYRALNYGDVVILCRSSSSFGDYEDAFEQAGIPFLTVAGRGFYTRPEIRDVLNVLHAINDPTDDLALVGLLSSPAFAVTDAGIYSLLKSKPSSAKDRSLWEWLQGPRQELSDDDGLRTKRAVSIVSELHGRAGRTPVADLLKAFLDTTDYSSSLLHARQTRAARNIDKLLDDAHKSNIVSVSEFLEYVTGLKGTGTREGEARSTPEGAVQIMSVHAAKGLEFPIVVIGDATYSGNWRNEVLFDPDLGIVLPVKDLDDNLAVVYRLAKEREKDQESAESDRLLYVAATRAREKLILSGCTRRTQEGTLGKVGGWLGRLASREALDLDGLVLQYDPEGKEVREIERKVGKTRSSCVFYEPGIEWDWRKRPEPEARPQQQILPPPLLTLVSGSVVETDDKTAEREREQAQQVWRVVPVVDRPSAPRWVVGSLVHEALAAWRFPDEGFDRWVESRARGYGITDSRQIKDAIQQARRILLRFKAHFLHRDMDASRRLHEVPYSLTVDGHVESGIIDALYQSDGTWTVVEFKTDRIRDEAALQELLRKEDYLKQAERYSAAVKRLLGKEPRVLLCMLDCANSVRIVTDVIAAPQTL